MFDTFVAFQARLQPDAEAILTPERSVSYSAFDADVNRFAAAFARLGLTAARGCVCVQLPDPYVHCLAVLALGRLGIASASGLDAEADVYLHARENNPDPRFLRLSPAWFAEVFAAEPATVAPVRAPRDGIGRVLLSSGTTRTPRRVGLTWAMIEGNVRSAAAVYGAGRTGRWVPFTGIDSILGLTVALTAWSVGASVAFVPKPALPQALQTLRPTLVAFTPVYLSVLLQQLPAGFRPDPQLRLVVGGSPLPRAVAQEALRRITPDIRVAYGATECTTSALGHANLLAHHRSLAGYACPGVTIEIVDAQGAPLPPGEQGEVRITAARAATSYLGDPEQTAQAFRDGAFHPGDLGRMQPDGLLIIDGRVDERLNLGGYKFLPNLMEDAAMACAGVADAAAFSAPDPRGIEHCWLAVVRGEGFDRARLAAHLDAHRPALPPVRFAWTDEIPRNNMGKIERLRLRQDAIGVLGVEDPAG
jgi:acyl-CoA synthetase (AMP-forming)/AMP-acid ligase II